jgi:hypothetical protein
MELRNWKKKSSKDPKACKAIERDIEEHHLTHKSNQLYMGNRCPLHIFLPAALVTSSFYYVIITGIFLYQNRKSSYTLKSSVFWVETPYDSERIQRFGRTHHFHVQGR